MFILYTNLVVYIQLYLTYVKMVDGRWSKFRTYFEQIFRISYNKREFGSSMKTYPENGCENP